MKRKFSKYPPADLIVCWLKYKNDLSILLNDGWYRIPLEKAPKNIFNVKYLAFYQSYVFGKNAYIIKHFGTIDKIQSLKRYELFPKEKTNVKSGLDYLKISMKDMNILEKPIVAKRPRKIVFINSTLNKLLNANDVNDLFHNSPLEDTLWYHLKKNNIVAERQYYIYSGKNAYSLDFAAFCRKGNVDIECDGDTYHTGKEKAELDNKRDNYLTKKGWSILRYNTSQLKKTDECVADIVELIYRKGGILR